MAGNQASCKQHDFSVADDEAGTLGKYGFLGSAESLSSYLTGLE